MVEITIQEIKTLQGADDLFAFAALGAVNGFNNHVGGDDVAIAGDEADDLVSMNLEVFFSKESGEAHGLVCGGVAPCPLIMGYTPWVWQAPQWSVHKSSVQPDASATARVRLKRVELTPDHVPQGVNHVIMARLLIRLALLRPALQF